MKFIIGLVAVLMTGCSFYGLSGGAGCFVPGTLVETPRGKVPIESLQADDEVISYDEETGQFTIGVVEALIARQVTNVQKVTLDNNMTIEVTPDHPVLTADNRWAPIGELAEGQLLTAWEAGHTKTVRSLTTVATSGYSGTVYNVKVRRYENAVVEGGLVAHFY